MLPPAYWEWPDRIKGQAAWVFYCEWVQVTLALASEGRLTYHA